MLLAGWACAAVGSSVASLTFRVAISSACSHMQVSMVCWRSMVGRHDGFG